MRDKPPSIENPADPLPDRPVEQIINSNPEYVSPGARQERSQKAIGNPNEDRIQREHLNRQDRLYQRGFPVAGHGEPEPVNNPEPRQRPKLVP
jgi:hypothetical protein